jgi:hypothetical protein
MLILKRIAMSDHGTFGVLIDDHAPLALTLERPWLRNGKNVSCIPEGNYICKRILSPKFGDTFEIKDVPERTHILFHAGNTMDHTKGCVLVGQRFGSLGEKTAVLLSRDGFGELMQRLKGTDEFLLKVESFIDCHSRAGGNPEYIDSRFRGSDIKDRRQTC